MSTLYNGIQLPAAWPPQNTYNPGGDDPMPVPYLDHPPPVIPIDVGRQLFVDDFLIEESSLRRSFHQAVKYDGNPVMYPETDLEQENGLPAAVPRSGGIWWDTENGCYRMWYDAGWSNKYAHATSVDGIIWKRPAALNK
ncbi:MAG: glycosyl hydrolase family 32, partial [Lentisphaerae bacterium]|nr:glycosyl hydrolase family 32 [Lentisphaerota bacterium]